MKKILKVEMEEISGGSCKGFFVRYGRPLLMTGVVTGWAAPVFFINFDFCAGRSNSTFKEISPLKLR